MDTQEIKSGCCRGLGGGHKRKVVIIILAVVLALAVLAIVGVAKKVRSERNFASVGCSNGQYLGNEKMLARCGQIPQDLLDPFYPPQDAAKKGELTVVAADSNHVTQAVTDIAAKNSGSVTSTKISYVSDGAKKGSMVIQIPADKFESVFNALKAMGARVVSESTEVLPQNNVIYPMSAEGQGTKTEVARPVDVQQDQNASNSVSGSSSAGVAMPAIYPYPQLKQDKGYIRILFSDKGKSGWSGNKSGAAGQTASINGSDFMVILGHNLLKGSFLILLIAVLLWFIKMLKAQKQKVSIKKTTIPAVKKVAVKKAVAVKRSKVIRKR